MKLKYFVFVVFSMSVQHCRASDVSNASNEVEILVIFQNFQGLNYNENHSKKTKEINKERTKIYNQARADIRSMNGTRPTKIEVKVTVADQFGINSDGQYVDMNSPLFGLRQFAYTYVATESI